MPYLALFLLLVALGLLFWAGRQRKKMGLPAGRVIYSDMRSWGKVEEPLYDPVLRLSGKPDYLVQHQGQILPVEVKSSRVNDAPYDSHIFQVAAYCRLVETVYHQRPSYGILKYPNRTFAIDYTAALEQELLNLLAEMRQDSHKKELHRSHTAPERCRRCGYRESCDEIIRL